MRLPVLLLIIQLTLAVFISASVFSLGIVEWEAPEYFFDADSARVTQDIAVRPPHKTRATALHPFQTLLTFPVTGILRRLFENLLGSDAFPADLAAQAYTLCMYGLSSVLFYRFAVASGHSSHSACLVTAFAATSFSLLTFGIVPESHFFGSIGTLLMLYALRFSPPRLPLFFLGWFVGVGQLISNLFIGINGVICVVGATAAKTLPARIFAMLRLLLVFFVVLAVCALVQKYLYSTGFEFSLHAARAETHWAPTIQKIQPSEYYISRLKVFIFHLVLGNIICWDPTVSIKGLYGHVIMGSAPIVFVNPTPLVILHGVVYLYTLIESFLGVIREWRRERTLLKFIALSTAYLILIHFFYGHNFFLYSPSWTVLLIASIILGLANALKNNAVWRRHLLVICICIATTLQLWVNAKALLATQPGGSAGAITAARKS